ncbi:ribonuclease H-like domain-containing protein [Tanacetum coccineum]
MSGSQDEIPPPPLSQTPTQQTPQTVSTIKLPILKRGEYDIWAMKMEHYLAHINYPIWEVIQNGNGPVSITTDTQGQIKVLPPRTAEEILARERERKARTTLLMALPEDHLAKFYRMTDAKEKWDAIKSRFGGNDESKKMQKYILKQQFEGFSVSNSEGLHKGYDRFQSLLSQLEIHGAGVSTEDANQKFIRSLPAAWSQVSLIMRTNPGVDSLSFDDLYNNLRVFENDTKGSTASSSSTQNVAFVSENTSSTNDVSIAYGVSNPFGQNSKYKQTSSYSLHANQSSCPQLDHKDLEQLDEFNLEEMDLKWQGILLESAEPREIKIVRGGMLETLEIRMGEDLFRHRAGGTHVVPPPMIGNYIPSGPDSQIDYSQFTYGPKQSQPSESETQISDFDTCESDSSEPTVNEPKVVSQPKVWYDAPIIEEYASDSEDEHVSLPIEEQETPSFSNQQVKTPRETIKNKFINSKNPKVDKKGLEYGFVTKACFVCGSLSHLIRDCDFHEKRMAKQAMLNNRLRKKSSQREIRPIWNNVQRVNHQNQFVPTAVLTRTGKIPVSIARASGTTNVSTARHNFNRHAVPTNAAMKVNTVKPIVNRVRPKIVFHKTHSPFSRPFNNTTSLKTKFSNQKVNIAELSAVSAVRGRRETTVKPSAGCNWRPNKHYWHKSPNTMVDQDLEIDYLHRALQNKGIIDSGCSRHMTRNKAYLAEYQDFNGGLVAFGGKLRHFNLFSVSQICDKKNKVLFTDSECLVLSPEFKLPDANQVLLRIPRQNNMYSFNLENIVPSGGLACLIAKATIDESNKWHRRLGHVNFKNLNKLVKGNLVRVLKLKLDPIMSLSARLPIGKTGPEFHATVLLNPMMFLQMILEIEPRNTKQYHAFKLTSKMFANMRLNFQGDHMPLLATMLPPAQAAIAGESLGEAAPSNPQTVPETITEPDHSHDHESTPPRPTTTTSSAPVNEQGPSLDLNIASSSRPHESAPDLITSTNVEDETMGGSFHTSPLRSTQAPPAGTTSDGAEALDKLTALSFLVSTLMQKVNTQESELKAHKLLFKEVVGKLVKRVKLLEDKLKGRKRKFVLTDSDKEEDAELDVDPLIKLAKAAAAASAVPTGGSHEADIPPSSSIPTDEFAGGSDVPADATTGPSTVSPSSTTVPSPSSVPAAETIPADSGTTPESPSSPVRDARKGKGVAVDEPTSTQDKTFKQLEEERLGWEAAQRLHAQELADFEKQRAESLMKDANLARQMSQDFEMTEAQRKRQQEVLASAANYSDAAWDIILARLQENPDLTSTIFGVEFTDDDFAARMVELVNTRRKELAEQRAKERRERPMTPSQLRQYMRTYVKNQGPAVYSTGWTMAQVRKLSSEQLQEEFDKIQRAVTRRKSLGARKKSSTELDLTADDRSFIRVLSDDSDDSNDDDDPPIFWPAFAAWEVVPTGLGDVNALYFMDKSSKYFTHLREILHLVDRKDLFKLYGMVVQYYEEHPLAGSGMILWGDLQVLFESHEGGTGAGVWADQQQWVRKNQQTWKIQSWKLYSYSGVHVLGTVSGLVVHMFFDKKYPLSVNLIERMLDHHLSRNNGPRLDADFLVADSKFMKVAFGVGFKMIAVPSSGIVTTSRYVVPTGRVKVPAGRYVVPTGKDNVIVSAGRTKVIPAGSTILVLCSTTSTGVKIYLGLDLQVVSEPRGSRSRVDKILYLLYGSAGVRVITAAGGRSYKENSKFKRKVATVPAVGFVVPTGLLTVSAASIIGPQTSLGS